MTKFTQSAIALSIGTVLGLSGCGGGGGGSDGGGSNTTPVPPMPETKTLSLDMKGGRAAISVEFVDAKTGELITRPVTLMAHDDVSGDTVYENVALGVDNPHTSGGATLFVKKAFASAATAANPVHFRLSASVDGYFDSSIDLRYSGADTPVQRIRLVNKAAPPAGVAVAVQRDVKADATGVLSTALDLTATTTDEASKGAAATFKLPAGTVLKDRTGQPLTGDLKVSIGYFSPNAADVGAIFPGGLSPESVSAFTNGVSGTRERQRGYFITAGLLAVDIVDGQGRKAHALENALGSMTIQTPAGLINPDTDEPIKDGDKVPVWSHNETTGLWSQERVATFKQTDSGNFEVTYEVNHLSYWNLDWWYYNGRNGVPDVICNTIGVSFSKPFSNQNLRATQYISNWGSHYSYGVASSENVTLYSVPNTREVTIKLTDNRTGELVGEGTKPKNSCANITINVTKEFPQPRNVPVQILLTAPQGFTKAQVATLINAMTSLTAAQRQAILQYTHPNDPNQRFKLDQAAYEKLMEKGLTKGHVITLQALMSLQIRAQGYFWGYDQDWQYYWNSLSNTGGMTLTLPNKDTQFKGLQTYTYNWYNWWTGQTESYSYSYSNAALYGWVQNSNGNWRYFNIPLQTPATIKKDATQGVIIFEDMEAMQRILAYVNSQTQSPN